MPIKTPRPSVRALKRRNSARSLCSAIRIFILPALLAVAGFCQTLPVDGDTLLLLRFEGTLNGVQGQAPQSASGVQFVPGLVGQGVNLTAGSQVIFSAANNISASEGTLEFWIKPNWNGNNGTSNYVLSWGQQGGMLFGKDSYPNWRMIANRFKTEIGVATSASGWQAGQWKHAAFTWSGTALCLYLNGVLVIQQNVSSALPAVSAATFQLGGDGSNVIDAVLDELRISRRARTSAEIQSDFATALPALDNTSGQVTTLVSSGLVGPWGVAVDGPGNVYIGDRGNNTIKKWNVSNQQVTTLVSSGLNQPHGVAVDGQGNVYIADLGNNAIKKWNVLNQQVTTLVSSGLNQPFGVAVDGQGSVYIADTGNNAIKKWNVSNQQVTTLVSSGLNQPHGVAVDGQGSVYIADDNNTIKKWNVLNQQVTTLVSSGLNQPQAVAVDGQGNVYIADTGRLAVEKWNVSNQQVTTLVARWGVYPLGVAVDGQGNVYISESGSNAIEKWTPAPTIRAQNGVLNGASFASPTIAPGTFMTIFGTNLASTTGGWNPVNGQLPTIVDGTSVLVNGRNAYVNYVSPGQINFLAPAGYSSGNVVVQVITSAGASNPVSVPASTASPGLFMFSQGNAGYFPAQNSFSGEM